MFIILHDIFLDEYIRYTLLNITSKIIKCLDIAMICKDMCGAMLFGNYPWKYINLFFSSANRVNVIISLIS